MPLVKTRLTEPKNNNRFRVTVQFEHGDADLSTYSTLQFKKWDDDQFIAWVAEFRQHAQDIRNMRSYGQPFNRTACEEALDIECESDQVYSGDYNYVANMYIDKVEWLDDDGVLHSVTGY